MKGRSSRRASTSKQQNIGSQPVSEKTAVESQIEEPTSQTQDAGSFSDQQDTQQETQLINQDIARIEEDSRRLRAMAMELLKNAESTSTVAADRIKKLTQKLSQVESITSSSGEGSSKSDLGMSPAVARKNREKLGQLEQEFDTIKQEIEQVVSSSTLKTKSTKASAYSSDSSSSNGSPRQRHVSANRASVDMSMLGSPAAQKPKSMPYKDITSDEEAKIDMADLHPGYGSTNKGKHQAMVLDDLSLIKKYKGPIVERQSYLVYTSAVLASLAILFCILGMAFPSWVVFTTFNSNLNPPVGGLPIGLQLVEYGLWSAGYQIGSTSKKVYTFVDGNCAAHICVHSAAGKQCVLNTVVPLASDCMAYNVSRVFYCFLLFTLIFTVSLLFVAVCRCGKGTGRLLLKYGSAASFFGSLLAVIAITVFTACLFVENGANAQAVLGVAFTSVFLTWFFALSASTTAFLAYFRDHRETKQLFYGGAPPKRFVYELEEIV